ncbi:hypothetical protein H0Z60_17225 [Ectothiorhodospiraceae bacterium WFHF3C12]|nr:hypothetical protein [Ectothiorhodospiraceae bacterium WFHF3C12]
MIKTIQRRIFRGILAVAMLSLAPIGASNAEEVVVEGIINGLECAIDSEWCPVDKLDPHIAFESDFVLQQRNGEFYLLVNLSRDTKVRYVLEDARVTGELKAGHNAIVVEKLEIERGGEFRTVWSRAMQREALTQEQSR